MAGIFLFTTIPILALEVTSLLFSEYQRLFSKI
jgi:hypothetical protein